MLPLTHLCRPIAVTPGHLVPKEPSNERPRCGGLQVVWQTVRPHNQEALTAEQLDEDVPKVLVGLYGRSTRLLALRCERWYASCGA